MSVAGSRWRFPIPGSPSERGEEAIIAAQLGLLLVHPDKV